MRPEDPKDRWRRAGMGLAGFLAIMVALGLAGFAFLDFIVSTCRLK
jgi:hypothetical protein